MLNRHAIIKLVCLTTVFAALAVQGMAQELLPLAAGNKWTLTNAYVSNPVVLEVISDETLGAKRRVRVRFTNPWSPYDFIFNPGLDGIMLEGLAVGDSSFYLSQPATMFPTGGTAGSTWNTVAGSVTLVSTSTTVASPAKTYTGCRHYRINLFGGVLDWFLAPGVGYVQLGTGPGSFLPGSINLNTYQPPRVDLPVSGACPKLGVDSNPPASSTFSLQEREAALAEVKAAGANFAHVSLRWSDIEKSPGVYDFADVTQWMSWASKYSLDVALTIRTVDTNTLSTPQDLAGRNLGDAAVIDRFVAMMIAMRSRIGAQVKWINTANEVDVYLRELPSAADSVVSFVQTVRSRLSATYGATSFGVVLTHASRSNPALVSRLVAASGHASFTYYPLNADLSPRPPSVVASEVAEMITLAGGKPLILTEVGYPSSPLLGSNESLQATFVNNVLDALRTSSGKISAASFFQRSDMPTTTVNALVQYYNAGGALSAEKAQSLGAFIGSLGLHTQQGGSKQSWGAFLNTAVVFAGANACTTR